MARIRTVKPEFFRHYELYKAEVDTGLPLRLGFEGLWTSADREGRFRWIPEELKLDCLPYDHLDFSRVLDALTTRGFIVKYLSGGATYGYIPGFLKHQVINNRERPSELPSPQKADTSTRDPRVTDACPTPLNLDQGEGKGKEGKGNISTHSAPRNFSLPPGELEKLKKQKPEIDWDLQLERFRLNEFQYPITDWLGAWQKWVLTARPTGRVNGNGSSKRAAEMRLGESEKPVEEPCEWSEDKWKLFEEVNGKEATEALQKAVFGA